MSRDPVYLAGRARCTGFVSAFLVLCLFVAAGAVAAADSAFARDQVELIGEVAGHGATHAIAHQHWLTPGPQRVVAVCLPRPTPRTRQLSTRGLPPPRAPTA